MHVIDFFLKLITFSGARLSSVKVWVLSVRGLFFTGSRSRGVLCQRIGRGQKAKWSALAIGSPSGGPVG